MKASQLTSFLINAIPYGFTILLKGKPGIGKSDIIESTVSALSAELAVMHPSISDPTDFKGQPYALNDSEATFLPYDDLKKLMDATSPLVCFIDDLGQASPSVQAALMQLLLKREIGGKPISKFVTFVAATNSKEDKAAVSGILEPVKSRFNTIIELEVDTDDWVSWALGVGNMPTELIAFIRYRPQLLSDFKPTKDIVNSPSPRTVAAVGKMMNAFLKPTDAYFYEVVKGSCGEAWAAEFTAFMNIYAGLPNIDQIFLNPDAVDVPAEPAVLYAISSVLASRITPTNAENAFRYIERLPAEISVACVKDTITQTPKVTDTRSFIKWSVDKGNLLFN